MFKSKRRAGLTGLAIAAAGVLISQSSAYAAERITFTTGGVYGVAVSGVGEYSGDGEYWTYEKCSISGRLYDTKADGHHVGVHIRFKPAGGLGGTVYSYYRRHYDGKGTNRTWNFGVNVDRAAYDDDGGGGVWVREFIGEGSKILDEGSSVDGCKDPTDV